MRKFDDFFDEQMKDPEFKTEYNNLQPEFDVIRAIIDARTDQNLTQGSAFNILIFYQPRHSYRAE